MQNSLVCVDANIVINALIAGPFRNQSTSLLARWLQTDIRVIVPGLFDYEVVSAIRRAVHLKPIRTQEGEDAYQQFLRIPRRRHHSRRALALSWELAKQHDRSRVYDASYLAVAQLHNCELWTADGKLYNAVQAKLPWVRWVDDIEATL